MTYNISVSEETYRLLERYRKTLEDILHRRVSYDDVLKLMLTNEIHLAIYSALAKKIKTIEQELKSAELAVPPARKHEAKVDKFVEFIKDVVVYPLDKIRAPKDKINRYVNEGIFKGIYASGKAYLIYNPKLQELWNKLPIPKDKVKELSREEQKLLEILKSAGLVYEDGITKSLRRVVEEL